jgi:hypothetical protein
VRIDLHRKKIAHVATQKARTASEEDKDDPLGAAREKKRLSAFFFLKRGLKCFFCVLEKSA